MEPGIDFNLVRSQKLLLIPQLKQALDILGMNSRELYDYVLEQLEANPLLEMVTEDRTIYLNDTEDGEDNADTEAPAVTLKEHLMYQLDFVNLERTQRRIGEYLIDNTDGNGYLAVEIREVAAFFNVPASAVSNIMKVLQSFDPPGICARNLKECLDIQLCQMEDTNKDAVLIVEKHLDELAENNVNAVAKETGLEPAKVTEAFKLIRSLEPRPGREFYKNDEVHSIMADVIVREIGKEFGVVLNEEAFPIINISEIYGLNKKALGGAGLFLKDKLRSAIWMLKYIEQRKNIILQIAVYILKEQPDFFEKGTSFLKLIKRKRLEYDLAIHESILAEALKGKHLQSKWGIFAFEYFFN